MHIEDLAYKLKREGFVVYLSNFKNPSLFYAKEGSSRIGEIRKSNGTYVYSRRYVPHKDTGSSCVMFQELNLDFNLAVKNIEDDIWVRYQEKQRFYTVNRSPKEYKSIKDFVRYYTKFFSFIKLTKL